MSVICLDGRWYPEEAPGRTWHVVRYGHNDDGSNLTCYRELGRSRSGARAFSTKQQAQKVADELNARDNG